jgi:transcription elongation GreA/GreB family factor
VIANPSVLRSATEMTNRKTFFVEELKQHYEQIISGAHRAEREASEGAEQIRAEARQKEDTKGALELGRLASAHRKRRQAAAGELEALLAFASRGLRPLGSDSAVAVGAIVDVSIESDAGSEERTLFVLPVGAGNELTGPGGDGFLSVITPNSPVGRALQGCRVGDSFEIVVDGHDKEWSVVDVC